jgi:hypothetical protein
MFTICSFLHNFEVVKTLHSKVTVIRDKEAVEWEAWAAEHGLWYRHLTYVMLCPHYFKLQAEQTMR